MSDTYCKACRKRIEFATTPEGKTIPLDVVAPVYRLVVVEGKPTAVRVYDCHVSHFTTCSDPARFSRSKKRRATV